MNTPYTTLEAQLEQALEANDKLTKPMRARLEEASKIRRTIIVCTVVYLICAILAISAVGIVAAGVTISVTTEESTVEQDTGDGYGNNVYLPGNSASYTEGG